MRITSVHRFLRPPTSTSLFLFSLFFIFLTVEEVMPALQDIECVCEGRSCDGGERCTGQQCFSSVKTSDGFVVHQKGCLQDDDQGRATCATPPSHSHIVKCCQGHLCNMNVTVEAPAKGNTLPCFHWNNFIFFLILASLMLHLSLIVVFICKYIHNLQLIFLRR